MTAAQVPQFVPYDAFLRTENASEDRHEWVNGVVYAMSRGTPEHARLTGRMFTRVLGAFRECESFAESAAIFIETAQHHTYADGILVCGPLVTRTVHDRNGKSLGEAIVNPTVIVEVLSESTERYDRDGKFEAYKKLPSFEAYVLVSQGERRLEVRTKRDGQWTTAIATAGESVVIHGKTFEVDAIFGEPS